MMKPTQELIDAIHRDRIRSARETPGVEKVLAGLEMGEFAVEIMTAGIRNQFPDADESEVDRILEERLNLARGRKHVAYSRRGD